MPRTAPLVSFGLYALAIKQDASFAFDADLQSFSKLNDLKTGNIASRPYITYEPDFWLLDGGYKFRPTSDASTHVGLMSLEQSEGDGLFSVPPTLTITFSEVHTSDGLTLKGSQYTGDYSNDIDVSYYDASDVLIRTDNYAPAGWEFSTEQPVTDFKKIEIKFNSTNKPYRYLRLMGIDFGELIYFTNEDIKSATVVEQVYPLSNEIPINTLELTVFSSDAAFSIINPSGAYENIQYRQPFDVYETVDGANVYIGQFFLDTWENVSDNEIKFNCVDLIGILNEIEYLGGAWEEGGEARLGDLIESMLSEIGVPYELDPDLFHTDVGGWIRICSYREALQQIAFAAGARVSCSRSGVVKIYKDTLASDLTSYDFTITKAEKAMKQSLKLKTLITGVEITYKHYLVNDTDSEIFNAPLGVGDHLIIFDNAVKGTPSISGGTITSSGANYANINVTSAGIVTLTGYEFNYIDKVKSIYNGSISSSVKKNIVRISDAWLVTYFNIDTIAQRVYDYYQQRYLQSTKLFAPTAAVGDSALIDTLYNQQIGGVIEKMVLDLTGGFTAQTEITGVVVE